MGFAPLPMLKGAWAKDGRSEVAWARFLKIRAPKAEGAERRSRAEFPKSEASLNGRLCGGERPRSFARVHKAAGAAMEEIRRAGKPRLTGFSVCPVMAMMEG